MPDPNDDYDEAEAARRRDAMLLRALKTPPEPRPKRDRSKNKDADQGPRPNP